MRKSHNKKPKMKFTPTQRFMLLSTKIGFWTAIIVTLGNLLDLTKSVVEVVLKMLL